MLFSFSCVVDQKESELSGILESYFDSIANNHDFNGAVLLRENNKTVFKKAYGYANLDLKTPFTTSTKMEIASVSKQFTSMAVLILREQGKLNLDSSANKYLEIPINNDLVTVRQLLTHTSGLPKYEKYFHTNWTENRKCTNKDILQYYSYQKPEFLFNPGTNFEYSNGGYVVLAEIVNFVSGVSLDVFLKENIFSPYKFAKTGFYNRDSILKDEYFAPGYFFDSTLQAYILPESIPGKEYYSYLSERLGPGRLISTVEELALWDSLLHDNFLISEESYYEMYTPPIIPDVETNYALGWRINPDSSYGWHVHHTGSWGGNKAYISRHLNKPYNKNNEDISESEDINLKTSEIEPDQTIIIFNNTNMKLMKSVYSQCDSIIMQYRKDFTPY